MWLFATKNHLSNHWSVHCRRLIIHEIVIILFKIIFTFIHNRMVKIFQKRRPYLLTIESLLP